MKDKQAIQKAKTDGNIMFTGSWQALCPHCEQNLYSILEHAEISYCPFCGKKVGKVTDCTTRMTKELKQYYSETLVESARAAEISQIMKERKNNDAQREQREG